MCRLLHSSNVLQRGLLREEKKSLQSFLQCTEVEIYLILSEFPSDLEQGSTDKIMYHFVCFFVTYTLFAFIQTCSLRALLMRSLTNLAE